MAMNFLRRIDEYMTGPVRRGQDMELEAKRIALEQAKRQMAAQASLMGGYDPTTPGGITWNTGRQAPNGMAQVQQPGGGFSRVPVERQSLMGAGLSDEVTSGLLAGPEQFKQQQRQDMIQADPQRALTQMQIAPALEGMTPEQRRAFQIDPAKAAESLSKSAFSAPPNEIQVIEGLKAKIQAFGAGTPQAKPYEEALAKATGNAPQSSLAKLKADLDAGRIDQATYDAGVQKENYIAPVASWRAMTEQEKRDRGLDANAAFKIDDRTGNYEIASTGNKYNNDQNLAAGFANRMDLASAELDKIGVDYPDFDPTSYGEDAQAKTNFTMTEANQLYRQAQENWVTANLRKESGAAIGDEEMTREIRKYFPQAGDKGPLIKQKERARAAAQQNLRFASGGAYDALKKSSPPAAAQGDGRPKDAPADARKAKDGNYYSPDPLRPGKFIKW